MHRSEKEWVDFSGMLGALWITDEDPRRPHAQLTSGNCSGCFFNGEKLMELPSILDEVASDLLEVAYDRFNCREIENVAGVVGPAMGAVTLAHDLARHIDVFRGGPRSCRRVFVEKDPADPKRIVLTRCEIKPGALYLPVEDVITTAGSVERTCAVVIEHGGIVLPYVLAILNRSGLKETNGKRIVALIDKPLPMWEPKDCPLCKAGSRPIRPKSPASNWALLTAQY
jgi:orotate phosphoribosyltransferase